ncbi:MAG: hypothetical protein ACKO96_07570, partial [Flammeovirgaceae bacterium]
METARGKQHIQDWITQQWVIFFGTRINRKEHEWLLGPFGTTNGIGSKFIEQLAEKEELVIDRNQKGKGLIQSIDQLNLPNASNLLPKVVIDFYENTSNYEFDLKVKWNPFFKGCGMLLKFLFTNRIEQLNLPIKNIKDSRALTSEIIQLIDTKSNNIKRTVWLRTFKTTKQVVYSGVYEFCVIPSGQTCIKAIFPLPNGNATVILKPNIGKNGELVLKSSGKKFGDSGFYFLLSDSKGNLWAKFIGSFEDKLVARSSKNDSILVEQELTLWKLNVLKI